MKWSRYRPSYLQADIQVDRDHSVLSAGSILRHWGLKSELFGFPASRQLGNDLYISSLQVTADRKIRRELDWLTSEIAAKQAVTCRVAAQRNSGIPVALLETLKSKDCDSG